MGLLLNLAYIAVLLAASPWLVWQSIRKGKYREGFAAKFLGRVPPQPADGPVVWLHAVSVGEVNLLATILAELARRRPNCRCVVSTTTITGMALAKKKYAALSVFYCPLDFTWAVRRAMSRVRPQLLVLAELELWPNLIAAARRQGAAVAVINGRLGEKSFRGYRRVRFLTRRVLERVDLIAAQDKASAQRFLALGARPETVHVTGSMKYDGAQTNRDNPATCRLAGLAGIVDGDTVFLAGSTQEPEESLALDAYRRLSPRWPSLRLVLVPRHPDRFDAVARLLDASGIAWQRRTRLEAEGPRPDARVLLVDVVGELGAWWGTAAIAFVGGSMGSRGGQNMIEPAAYGAAVSFGPCTHNFRDIVATLLAEEAAVVVRDGAELTAFVERSLDDPAWRQEIGERARRLVRSQQGATERTFTLLASLLPTPAGS